jgi:hypothetical protein
MDRATLEAYLSRAMTNLDLLSGMGDLDDNIRMLSETGVRFAGRAVYRWGSEASLPELLDTARTNAARIHEPLPHVILQGCVFEIVTTQVERLPIPLRVFLAFGRTAEDRCFQYADMLYPDGTLHNQWGENASVPDITQPETQLWFYYLATSYIDIGCEAIHIGQAELMGRNDHDRTAWWGVLSRVREFAAEHARRGLVLFDGHVPSGGMRLEDGRLLMDFHSFPLRIEEVDAEPHKGVLEMGHLDSIYGRSWGGLSPLGWTCDQLPYLVELDNWGASDRPGENIGAHWIWGYDEISWFAHQAPEYRRAWLQYAWNWVRQHDPNGFLQMPGSRCLHTPVPREDGSLCHWYYVNRPTDKVPDGFGDEDAVRDIWSESGETR